MARKHGFQGTPVRPSPRPSSNASVFEKRGDPFVSQREGNEDYGRNLETENPDYDRMFAGVAADLLKPKQVDRRNALRDVKPSYDSQRAANNNILVTRKKVAEAQGRYKENNVPNSKTQKICCPYQNTGCGFTATDSRAVSLHLRQRMKCTSCDFRTCNPQSLHNHRSQCPNKR